MLNSGTIQKKSKNGLDVIRGTVFPEDTPRTWAIQSRSNRADAFKDWATASSIFVKNSDAFLVQTVEIKTHSNKS